MSIYRQARLLTTEMGKMIKRVVNDCRICQKFGRTMITPKVLLTKNMSFNEMVTLDLKEFGSKYVLWHMDLFTHLCKESYYEQKSGDNNEHGQQMLEYAIWDT